MAGALLLAAPPALETGPCAGLTGCGEVAAGRDEVEDAADDSGECTRLLATSSSPMEISMSTCDRARGEMLTDPQRRWKPAFRMRWPNHETDKRDTRCR